MLKGMHLFAPGICIKEGKGEREKKKRQNVKSSWFVKEQRSWPRLPDRQRAQFFSLAKATIFDLVGNKLEEWLSLTDPFNIS